MTEGVTNQAVAEPEKQPSDKELNFRRLEAEREKEREARMRAEMQAQMLQKEMESIKEMLKPKEVDPLESEDIDPDLRSKLEAKLAKERQLFERKAEEIAKNTYQRIEREREEAEKKNFIPKLQKEYSDYDKVMTEENIASLEKLDPTFLRTVLMVPDEYERRKATYERLKSLKKDTPSVQEKVAENQRKPYHFPSVGAPTTNALSFDLNTREAREAAYKMLKDAQRKPLGSRPT